MYLITDVVQYIKKTNPEIRRATVTERASFSDLTRPNGDGFAESQVQHEYLKEMIPKIRGIKIEQNGGGSELVILVGQGVISELVRPTGDGIARPQVQYLKEIIPNVCGTKRRPNGGFGKSHNPSS